MYPPLESGTIPGACILLMQLSVTGFSRTSKLGENAPEEETRSWQPRGLGRSRLTICSGLYLFLDMTGPPQVNSHLHHLVPKTPVSSPPLFETRDSVEQEGDFSHPALVRKMLSETKDTRPGQLFLTHISSLPVVPGKPLFTQPAPTPPLLPPSPIPVGVLFAKRISALEVGLSAVDCCQTLSVG